MSHHLSDRPAIPDDNAPVSPAHRPTWWTVRTVRSIAFVCVGLAVALSLVSTLVSWRSAQAANSRAVEVEQRLAALEEYVQGRGEYRDREAERMEREAQERLRVGICDLLDQFPGSAPLDVARGKYGCGPGTVPPPPGPVPSTAAPAPEASSTDATPDQPRQAPAAGPAPTAAPPPVQPDPAPDAPTPEAPPVVPPAAAPSPRVLDLEPLTDPVCAVLGVCL